MGDSRIGSGLDFQDPEPARLLPRVGGLRSRAQRRRSIFARICRKLLDNYGYAASLYGHFGQGCVHCSIDFDLYTHEGIEKWKHFLEQAAMLVTSYGGSLSGEHGDGQARGSLLPIMFGNEIMQAFREFKSLWDPMGRMNPGKVVDAYSVDENLRWGTTLRTVGTRHTFRVPPGSRPLLICSQSMRRYRQVPQARQRHHVPELHGDARRASLDPGASSAPVRDAGGQPARSGMAGYGRKGGPRSLPRVQRMSRRVSRERRHGDVQGRISRRITIEGRLRPRPAYAFGLMYWWAGAAARMPGFPTP